ncbi:Metallo-beta-lactamase superfamily protein [Mycena sanguinolenta]|uniref:Metallo-beta-lactamase superfamily protein n=1 Tax=Mycena sanguinolenta TaxID=230812 RepID=A0A8H7DJH5_9AGAR|nr:Metallo-beta-lactamase superfamily protein [Mycena sanguinolenta]
MRISIGDMSIFPNSTTLVVGSETNTSAYPRSLPQSEPFRAFTHNIPSGRTVTKIDFSAANLTFSGMKAVDYFGDGSFLNASTPGHLPGHLSALARVTPTTFIALGGDTFHHVAETSISTDYFWSPDSSDGAFDKLSRAQQFFVISDLPDSFAADPVTAQISLEKIATFDADPDIFVAVAHDSSLMSSIPYFPAYLNDWQASGLK